MLIENVKKVEEIWKTEGLKITPPFSKTNLIAAFDTLKVPVSKDVIDVYSNLGGMADDASDCTLFSFWPIEKILAESELGDGQESLKSGLTAFADFLIYSNFFCFKYENDETSSIHIYWSKDLIEKIADSFDDFFENYIANPEKYYLFERES